MSSLAYSLVGWLGAALLALCGLPQAVKSLRQGHSQGLAWSFLLMWGVGELLMLIYVIPKGGAPLLCNYAFNLLLVSIMLFYKAFPRKRRLGPRGPAEVEQTPRTV